MFVVWCAALDDRSAKARKALSPLRGTVHLEVVGAGIVPSETGTPDSSGSGIG